MVTSDCADLLALFINWDYISISYIKQMPVISITTKGIKNDYKITKGNILKVYNQATQSEFETGIDWYQDARQFVDDLESELDYQISKKQIAGVIAALSVQNEWEQNKKDAREFCKAFVTLRYTDDVITCTYPKQMEKAEKILFCGDDSQIETILGKNANKTKNFYRCIIGDVSAITIDGHAFNIASNRVTSLKEVPAISKKNYEIVQNVYKQATNHINKVYGLNLKTSDLQAVTWVTYKRLHNK